jgi:PAS domain S-box-containing protein
MEKTEDRQMNSLLAYSQRLEEMVSKRSSEFAILNSMLTRECRQHRITEDGLLLRAAILDNTGESVFLGNDKGGLTYVNDTATVMYGYDRSEFLNMKLPQLLKPSPDAIDLELKRLANVLQKGQYEVNTVHQRKDRSLLPVHVLYKLIKTAHGVSIVIVTRDITDEVNLRMFMERLPAIIWTTDANMIVTSISGTGRKKMGFETSPPVGLGLVEFLEKAGTEKETKNTFLKAVSELTDECCPIIFNASGQSLKGWIVLSRDCDGQLLGTTTFLMDVSETN